MTDSSRIRLVLSGAKTGEGSIELDALVGVGDALRRALLATARSDAGLPAAKSGHPGTAIRESTALRLVGISSGSAVLELEPVDERLIDPTVATLERLADSIARAGSVETAVVAALDRALDALGDGASIGLALPGRPVVTVDRERLAALRSTAATSVPAAVDHVDGWLHAVDFQPQEIRVRDASRRDWVCEFGPELERTVLGLLNQSVRVTGAVGGTSRKPRIVVSAITSLLPLGVTNARRGLSGEEVVAEAMATAGVTGPQPVEALVMEGIDDEEWAAFEAALREIR